MPGPIQAATGVKKNVIKSQRRCQDFSGAFSDFTGVSGPALGLFPLKLLRIITESILYVQKIFDPLADKSRESGYNI